MKKKKSLKIIEKICITGIVILAVITILGICRLYKIRTEKKETFDGSAVEKEEKQPESYAPETEEADEDLQLTEPADFLPQNLAYGKKLPVTMFERADGTVIDLLESYPGETLVLMYWGSWCSYCDRQLQHLEEFHAVLDNMESVRLILINKTDAQKGEDVQKAVSYLEERGFSEECVYDTNLTAYQAYGIRRIPTTIVADGEGYVRAMEAGVIDSGEKLENLLDYAQEGGAALLLDFLNKNMKNENGGIYTNYLEENKESPSGHDVLSESMGLMMEYAAAAENQELFDEAYTFVKEHLENNGLFSWYVSENGEAAGANAFLDDIRIAGALLKAHNIWGGYEEYAKLAENIIARNAYKNQISSFYDFTQKLSGSEISLCYADFQTLDKLSKAVDGLSGRIEALQAVVQQGYIGDEFPLYYSSWDYKKKTYAKKSLNTAEALLTLYHLAQADLLKENSLEWLRERLLCDNLAARYETDGRVPDGYAYDSTAVYAIAALIGRECQDAQVYMLAVNKMEQARVTDVQSPFYGAFTNKSNGGDLTAFDQLMPLLVYAGFGTITFE